MNTTRTKNGLLLVCLLWSWFCYQPAFAETYDYAKQKKVSRTFPVSKQDLLQVDNQYGNVTVTHWNKNEVAIRVEIESKANDEKVAQLNLDRVDIEMKKEDNRVSAVTLMKKNSFGGFNHTSLTIHYYIEMPSWLASQLALKYGNISLPKENAGKTSILLKYGNLYAGDFSADLDLEVKYSNVEVGNLKNASIDLSYVGNMVCKKTEDVTVESKYSKLTLDEVRSLKIEKKYGNLQIGRADRIWMNMKYSNGNIDYLKEELNAENVGYGDLNIKRIDLSFKGIDINARYGNVTIGIPSKAAFRIDAEDIKYGKVKVKGFSLPSSSKESRSYFQAEINGGGNRQIRFNGNNYSNLTIHAL